MPSRRRQRERFAQWSQFREAPTGGDEVSRHEDEILNIFVDICSLFRRKPNNARSRGGEGPSTEAYLFSYSRMLETHGEGLPPAFVEALRRALGPLWRKTLDRSPELEESLLWIYKSHHRVERQVAPIVALLERRLALRRGPGATARTSRSGRLLDRLIAITRGLFPSVSDLARELRYRYFSSRRCLSRRVNRFTRKPRTILPILPPIQTRGTDATKLTR